MKRLIVSMVLGLSLISPVKAEEKELTYKELAEVANEYGTNYCLVTTDKSLSRDDKRKLQYKALEDIHNKYPQLYYLSPDQQKFFDDRTNSMANICVILGN